MRSIIGWTDNLRKYSLYATRYDAFSQEQCKFLLPKVQMEICQFKSTAERRHNEWELSFYEDKKREPRIKDLTGEVKINFNAVLLAKDLLKEWKIRW